MLRWSFFGGRGGPFCAKPTKYDLILFSPRNNNRNHPQTNLAASHAGKGPSCPHLFCKNLSAVPPTVHASLAWIHLCKTVLDSTSTGSHCSPWHNKVPVLCQAEDIVPLVHKTGHAVGKLGLALGGH